MAVISGLNNNWIIISVILPGVVFFTAFFILFIDFGIQNSAFMKLNENAAFTAAIVTACGLVVQLFGMISEKIGFKLWNRLQIKKWSTEITPLPTRYFPPQQDTGYNKIFWIHRYWEKRYTLMALSIIEKDSVVERYIAQFHMAHNISVGLGILLISTIVYLNSKNIAMYHIPELLLLITAFALALFVTQLRFKIAIHSVYDVATSKRRVI